MNLNQNELLSQLRGMDEYEFEQLVADVWEQRGWETTVTTGSSDRGIDVIAEKSSPFSQKHLIQAKRYSTDNKIGSPDIQQYSSLRQQEDDVDAVVVITTSSFSSQACKIANDLNVKLVDGGELCDVIFGLDSQSFLSDYFNTDTATRMKSTGSRSHNQKEAERSNNKSRSNLAAKQLSLPDNFQNGEKTTELGKFCPICGGENTIWEGKTVNTDPMLFCEGCGTKWSGKINEPLLFGSKEVVWWKAIGEDMKKEPSEWKDMNPNRSR